MRLMMDREELRKHLKDVSKTMNPEKMGEYYTKRVVRKYSKKEQEEYFDVICDTILNVPGGYWQIVDNMNYLPEYEHYRMKTMLSYEKDNVPRTIAKRELSVLQYANIYKRLWDNIEET